jgi:hypothetical protein
MNIYTRNRNRNRIQSQGQIRENRKMHLTCTSGCSVFSNLGLKRCEAENGEAIGERRPDIETHVCDPH